MQFIDQLNRTVELKKLPSRIVSLVPSQTELLIDLGLSNKLVGITKFCIHPNKVVKSMTKIGGTKNFNIEKIRSLNPDLIIANKEENEETKLKELMKEFPVWISDVRNLNQAFKMITEIGLITGKEAAANLLSQNIRRKFEQLESIKKTNKRVIYLIWKNPFMSINKDTFIHSMIEKCGWNNIISEYNKRYPELSTDEIINLKADTILLSSEPYPFKEKHIEELKKIIPQTTIKIVDGEAFSWYGSKLLTCSDYFTKLSNEQ
jgi:ABC-type Fe3+-hydroxamate transport system substrate-binding protein